MMSAIVLIAMVGWHVAMVVTTDVGLFDIVTTLKAALKDLARGQRAFRVAARKPRSSLLVGRGRKRRRGPHRLAE